MIFWTASLETRNFDFVAYAIDREGAIGILKCAWEKHRREMSAPLSWNELADDVQSNQVEMNTAYRDGTALYRARN